MRKVITLTAFVLSLFSYTLITFAQAPSITQQPKSQGVIAGQTATFSVKAQGDTLTYQWYKDGTAIPLATDSIYTTLPTITADNGSVFSVKVTNSSGSDSSNGAVLYVTASGSRVTSNEIAAYNFKEGSGTTINDISGFETPLNLSINDTHSILWTPNGLSIESPVIISSDTAATKLKNACLATNELTIEAWIVPDNTTQGTSSNGAVIVTYQGSNEFRNFTLQQNGSKYESKVRIANTTNSFGEPFVSSPNNSVQASLSQIVYTRSSDGKAKIFINGTEVSSDSLPDIFVSWDSNAKFGLASKFGGKDWFGTYYYVGIYNRALSSSEVSHNYSIGVTADNAPYITEQPEDQGVIVGETAVFEVKAVGKYPLSYQWQTNGTDITGATDSIYTPSTSNTSNNNNRYTVIVSNSFGADTSRNARLSVTDQNQRVTNLLQAFYNFKENSGTVIHDVSGAGTPLDLTINSPSTVTWTPSGLRLDSASSITSDGPATKLFDSINFYSQFSVETWIRTSNTTNTSMLVSMSKDGSNRNFTLMKRDNGKYEARVRTTETSLNGSPFINTDVGMVNTELTHVVYTKYHDGSAKIYVNGVEKASGIIYGNFANWDSTYKLILGNELDGGFDWEGLFNLVAIYSRALSPSEVEHNYAMGPLGTDSLAAPGELTAQANIPGKINLSWKDSSNSETGFIIERKINTPIPSSYFVIDSTSANDTTYVDMDITDTTSYTYRVKAFNDLVESDYSNEATVTSLLSTISAPSNLTAMLNSSDSTKVDLNWTDNSSNETGFVIERKTGDSSSVNPFAVVDTVAANQTAYTDSTVSDSTTYTYRVYAFNNDTISAMSNIAQITTPVVTGIKSFNQIPKEYSLDQNYPNPFNPSTIIRYALPKNAKVTITLYNTLGQEITKIFDGELNAGIHEVNFNASNLSSGVYFYRLSAKGVNGSNFVSTKRMLLLK